MDLSSKDGRTGRDDLENNNGDGGEKDTAKSDGDSASEKPTKPLKPASLVSLFRYADALDYVLMAIGSLGAIAHGGAVPIFMRVLGETIDSFGSNVGDPELMIRQVGKMGITFVIIGAIIGISSWAEISFFMWSGERQVVRMRIKYLDSVLNKNIGYFDTDIRASDIVHTMNADTITIQDILSAKFVNFIRYTASFVSGFVVGFTIVWQLGLVVIAIVPPMVIIGVVQTTALSKLTSKSEDALAESGNVIEQSLFQIKMVQSFTGESKVLKAYSSALRMVQRAGYKCGLVKGLGTGSITFITFLCYTLILWYAGRLVRDGKTNGGLAIATIFSILIGGMGLVSAFPCLVEITKGRVSAARIYQTIDHKQGTNKDEEVKGLELESVTGHLELKDVDFTYPSRPDIPILQRFSLKIEALKSLALVGTSGSGKSTVISLIERFYDPNSGQVLLDGHDVRTLKLKFLRQQIGLVSQESALFGTTIRENILLGRPNATEAEVEEAAKNANAHYFISQLPNGYDSQVGEKGLQLSGGQKQRIAIARAMLKDPKILLLDEATSALDSESEKLVHEALDGFMADRTTLMIAHRLSTIRNANLVAVLQRGSILESGTHDELMANEQDGMYAKLIQMHEMTNGTSFMRARRSSARASNACSSGRTSIGRSSISHRPSDFSTTEFKLALDKVALHEQASSYCRLAKKSSPEWRISLLGLISSMACGALSILFTYIISAVLTVYYAEDYNYMEREILKYCYIMLGVSSLAFVFNTSKHLFWDIVGENLIKRVREEMLEVILRNEIAWFDLEENATSSVSARLTSDAHYVQLVIANYTSVIVQNMTILSVACIVGLVLQWQLALLLIAMFPIIGLVALMQKTVTKGFTGDIEAAHFKATQIAGEAVTNIKVVTSFNSQSDIINLFSEKLQDPLRNCFKKGQTVGISFGLSHLVLLSSYALSWWFASWLVKNNMATFSRCITVFIVMMISASSATEPLTMMPDFIKGGRAVKSAFETIDRETKINPDDNPDVYLDLDSMRGELELKHVDFSYPSDPDVLVLRDFSLRARAKKGLAIVGPSGSGKSTIISLMQRFYEPFCGCVLIDGNDIRKYNLKSLRKAMAMVPQEPLLFATTVYDNIAYGSENANEAEVIEAAKVANADRFVSELPEGYQTILGERGVQLSGGQRQRIAIARAFLKKAPIMLLDEATSALDIESERSVHEALGRATKGRTTIIVAHRLSTIRNADSIAVIDEGKVVEQGSDSHLMKNSPDGVYARMVKLQKLSSN